MYNAIIDKTKTQKERTPMNNTENNFGSQQHLAQITGATDHFFKNFKIATLLHRCGVKKAKGISALILLTNIFSLAFSGKNFYQGIVKNKALEFGKDAAYEFLKEPRNNWRKILLSVGAKIFDFFDTLTDNSREKVLIIDDSSYDRSRSKNVELLARVYDHAEKKFIKGFRMLTLCWSDGASAVPLDFALLSSKNKNNRLFGQKKEIDKRTSGYKRRAEAVTKATDLLPSMVERVGKSGIRFDYILMDSWFSWPKLIASLLPYAHVICMVKKTKKVLYKFQGQRLDVKAIYQRVKKRRGRAKILCSVVVKLSCGTPVRLVFVRDRRKKDWLVLLSTDTSLADEEIVRIYGKRWDIEVFFKMCKQYLRLVKEMQARDYDSLIAHTTVVFMRYQFLAYEQRMRIDDRTFGGMFYDLCDEVKDLSFIEAMHRILSLAIEKLRKSGTLDEEIGRTLIDAAMGAAIDFFRLNHLYCQRT